jgi:hypothetical protein
MYSPLQILVNRSSSSCERCETNITRALECVSVASPFLLKWEKQTQLKLDMIALSLLSSYSAELQDIINFHSNLLQSLKLFS